jgi:hypothetical protein
MLLGVRIPMSTEYNLDMNYYTAQVFCVVRNGIL